MVAEADYRIKLPVFEGPLDLLLFLIRKNELDIYDIPISTVTKQYLDVIYAMKELGVQYLLSVSAVGSMREDIAALLRREQFASKTAEVLTRRALAGYAAAALRMQLQ